MSEASSKKNNPVIQFNAIQSGKKPKVRRVVHRIAARSVLDCRMEPPEKKGRSNRKRKPSESEIESGNESEYQVSEDEEDGEEKSEEEGEEEVEEEVEEDEGPTGTPEESETLDGEKKKKISKKQQKIPIQFPKMDVDEDVYSMKQIPLDFHYKRVVKPGHKDEEWLQIEIDESCIEKTKKTPAIKKVVHIEKNNNFKRAEMMEKVRLHFDHYDASKSAKDLHEEMIREPTAFQMVALISDDQSKIDKKLNKKACNGEAFDFFEIVRKPTNENPFPFTGKYIIFQSFLKMI